MPDIDKDKINHILISRIDAIGDVVLTLPMCAYLKELFPNAKISFLGRSYTKAVINTCTMADAFVNYDEIINLPLTEQYSYIKKEKIDAVVHVFPDKALAGLMKRAGIRYRIGTTNRWYHWLTCNKLVRLSRKKSDLHEAQLNLVLLQPFGLNHTPSLQDIAAHYHFKPVTRLSTGLLEHLSPVKFNLIMHPKSNGSGREWAIHRFSELIALLPADQYNIIITGTEKEGTLMQDWLPTLPKHVVNLTGKMQLDQLIAFIAKANGLLASGTGPLHLAAACGIHTLGLFPSSRPIHPGRWAPVGRQAEYIESGTDDLDTINAAMVFEKINAWKKNK